MHLGKENYSTSIASEVYLLNATPCLPPVAMGHFGE